MDVRKTFWGKAWKDKNGNLALWQKPNMSLLIWIILFGIGMFLEKGNVKQFVDSAARLVLFAWARMELLGGVNYFRQAIGFIVGTATLISIYRLVI